MSIQGGSMVKTSYIDRDQAEAALSVLVPNLPRQYVSLFLKTTDDGVAVDQEKLLDFYLNSILESSIEN